MKCRFDEELKAEDGIEKQYVKKFLGTMDCTLDLLSYPERKLKIFPHTRAREPKLFHVD